MAGKLWGAGSHSKTPPPNIGRIGMYSLFSVNNSPFGTAFTIRT